MILGAIQHSLKIDSALAFLARRFCPVQSPTAYDSGAKLLCGAADDLFSGW